jgi:hypothetical protein
MRINEALHIVRNDIITQRGVRLKAQASGRLDDTIVVQVIIRPRLSQFPPDYPVKARGPVASNHLVRVDDLDSAEDLLTRVADVICRVSEHEIREFTRLRPDYRAPVHPHKGEGIDRWAAAHDTDPMLDRTFGVA